MDALDLLMGRASVTRLVEPGPSAEQLDLLFRAAMRAPDHAQLRPWRFLTVAGEARQQLGELFAGALQQRQPEASAEALDKARRMPLRAPLLVIAIARLQAHPKVPDSEQLLTAGCAVHGMLLAAHALGIGGVWRTGEFAYDSRVAEGLGLADNERLIGFIYLGTPDSERRAPTRPDPAPFVGAWGQAG